MAKFNFKVENNNVVAVTNKEELDKYIISSEGFDMAQEIANEQDEFVCTLLSHKTLYKVYEEDGEYLVDEVLVVVDKFEGGLVMYGERILWNDFKDGDVLYSTKAEAENRIKKINEQKEIEEEINEITSQMNALQVKKLMLLTKWADLKGIKY